VLIVQSAEVKEVATSIRKKRKQIHQSPSLVSNRQLKRFESKVMAAAFFRSDKRS